jgi:uncharacterized UBP type Zn finger protein
MQPNENMDLMHRLVAFHDEDQPGWNCDADCPAKVPPTTTRRITGAPDVLSICFARNFWDDKKKCFRKLRDDIDYPEDLDLSQFSRDGYVL